MPDIVLTKQQRECVAFPEERNLLVRGIAGSGKSLVLVNRAVYLREKAEEKGKHPKIALFTFVNSLVDYTREVALTIGGRAGGITISTIDKQAYGCYRQMFGSPGRLAYNVDKRLLADAVRRAAMEDGDSRFLRDEYRDFLADEIGWMRSRSIHDAQTYVEGVRVGRGSGKGSIRVSRGEREVIYHIYADYFAHETRMSADEMYERILAAADRIPDAFRYDFVMLDESQDLSLNKLRYAKAIARKSLTIAADQAQKIYSNGFTWKEIGIRISGQSSKKLTGTFRNTREIAQLANSLMKHNTEREAQQEEYVEPELPDRRGPKPVLVREPSLAQEAADICALVREERSAAPQGTIALLARSWEEKERISDIMRRNGIPYGLVDTKSDTKILEPGVKIVTIHSAKGLEFDTVLIPYLDEDVFPKNFSKAGADEREDLLNKERNLLYVAMTRAKETLYLYTLQSSPSPLVAELDANCMDVRMR